MTQGPHNVLGSVMQGARLRRFDPRYTGHQPQTLMEELRRIYGLLSDLSLRLDNLPVPEVPAPGGGTIPGGTWELPEGHLPTYFYMRPIEIHGPFWDLLDPITPLIPDQTAFRHGDLKIWLLAAGHLGQGCGVIPSGGLSEWWFEVRYVGNSIGWVDEASPIYPAGYSPPSDIRFWWWEFFDTEPSSGENPNSLYDRHWPYFWFNTGVGGDHYFQLRGYGQAWDPDDPVDPCGVGDQDACYLAVIMGEYQLAPAWQFGNKCNFLPYE